jgi:hypothetical protein
MYGPGLAWLGHGHTAMPQHQEGKQSHHSDKHPRGVALTIVIISAIATITTEATTIIIASTIKVIVTRSTEVIAAVGTIVSLAMSTENVITMNTTTDMSSIAAGRIIISSIVVAIIQ